MDKPSKYQKRKASGTCARCPNRVSEKALCDDCAIANLWSSSRAAASEKGYQAIALTRNAFVVWYKNRRDLCGGMCEWCGEPFGLRGPVADYDRTTGEVRALLCARCKLAEGVGLERLKKIVAALDQWHDGARAFAPVTTESRGFEHNFKRWAAFVNKPQKGREGRIQRVVKELRDCTSSQEELEAWFLKFRIFLEEHAGDQE